MRIAGELCLLLAFVGSGFAAFVQLADPRRGPRQMNKAGTAAGVLAVLALTGVTAILAWALFSKDFRFAYVADYSSHSLPWYYSLSALWVGQAGSLLLWAWFMCLLAMAFRWRSGRHPDTLRAPAFGILMGYLCFLLVIMVFAADPMAASLSAPHDGLGLSPLLQHPAMLIHPPIVFLGYALWTVPFALAMAALLSGQLDADWIRQARPWALLAWAVLGVGILLGADWAYEELGWGGYWAWDPVENGSLLPWLTGTALIHNMMAWQHRQMLKRSTLVMAFATFGLCNFATFLTRSGVFSSLHAFSHSPIGWLFLGLMVAVAAAGIVLLVQRRAALVTERTIPGIATREAGIMIGSLALVLLALAVLLGTLSSALSAALAGRAILVGPAFYNNALIPAGLLLLLSTAAVPLLRWGRGPSSAERRGLWLCGGVGGLVAALSWLYGSRQPLAIAVIALAAAAFAAVFVAWVLDARRHCLDRWLLALPTVLRLQRRQYASYTVHLGFVCLALGITGSSLAKREEGFVLTEGQTVHWAGRQIRLVRVIQRQTPDRLIGEAELEISRAGGAPFTLIPAQHFHRLQEQWTTEVAIHSTWRGDFYAILHSGELDGRLYMTFVENPLMRWIWVGGGIMVLGTGLRLWPARRRRKVVALGETHSEEWRRRAA